MLGSRLLKKIMNNTLESEKTSKTIYKIFFVLMVPILAFSILFVNYQNNNIDLLKKEYEKKRNIKFSGRVIEKKKDGDYPRAHRYVYLKNYREVIISNELYTKIAIGDSVSKVNNCDSIYFYLKNGAIEIEDYNQFSREKYQKLKIKKRKE